MWAVVGLGNPGKAYAGTRHNAGFMLVGRIAEDWGLNLKGKKFQAKTGESDCRGEKILLALPQTYMNNSGLAVRDILKKTKIEANRIVVVYDDLDLPVGRIRVRKQGSAGTHKGMQSIIRETGSRSFPRIRIGIGPLPPECDAADFVLSLFPRSERHLLTGALDDARSALLMILDGRIDTAMTRFNTKEGGL